MNSQNYAAGSATSTASGAPRSAGVQAHALKVNGNEISPTRFTATLQSRLARGQPDTPQLRTKVRNRLIEQEIAAQAAIAKGLDKNPEVLEAIEASRVSILAAAYWQECLRENPVSEETLKQEYERLTAHLGNRECKVRHILAGTEEEAKDIIAQIAQGTGFEKLAAERSKDKTTRERGGDLGWVVPATYAKPFADALAQLKKGQVTEAPIRTLYGWHVIQLEDERAYTAPTFDVMKPKLKRAMQQSTVDRTLAQLLAKSKIEAVGDAGDVREPSIPKAAA